MAVLYTRMLNIEDTTQKEKFNMELQEYSDLKHNELAQVRNQRQLCSGNNTEVKFSNNSVFKCHSTMMSTKTI
jgi:hypothetical protein